MSLARSWVVAGAILIAAWPVPAADSDPEQEPVTSPGLELALQLEEAFASVAERVFPSVVKITVYAKGSPEESATPGAPGWREPDPEATLYPGHHRLRSGSGFLVSDDGFILTCRHNLLDPAGGSDVEIIDIEIEGNRHVRGRIVGGEPTLDLAVLKVEVPFELHPAILGDSAATRVGQWSIALGDPAGAERTYVAGNLSATPDRQCYQGQVSSTLLQSSFRIHPESYGGPLVDIRGRVIGINVPRGDDPMGRGPAAGAASELALPINLALTLLEAMKVQETSRSPWLGVSVLELSWQIRKRIENAPRTGVYIDNVFDPSPASRAGIAIGDVIIEIDGHRLLTVSDFQHWLYLAGIGNEIRLGLARSGELLRKKLIVEQRPPAATP